MTYYSKSIPLQEIASLEKTNVYLYPFPLSKWVMKVGPRLHYFSLKFWKPGLQVNLKNGKSYVFSVESAEEVIKELDQFLPKEEKAELGMAIPLAC